MMIFLNRKGVSEVVANVLIVLLVIVGVAVIWSVVKPTIDESAGQIDSTSDCFGNSVEVTSCSPNTGNWDVVVKRNAGGEGTLVALRIIFEDSLTGSTAVVTPTSVSLDQLETQTFTNLDDSPITADRVNVAAVVGNELKVCEPLAAPTRCI